MQLLVQYIVQKWWKQPRTILQEPSFFLSPYSRVFFPFFVFVVCCSCCCFCFYLSLYSFVFIYHFYSIDHHKLFIFTRIIKWFFFKKKIISFLIRCYHLFCHVIHYTHTWAFFRAKLCMRIAYEGKLFNVFFAFLVRSTSLSPLICVYLHDYFWNKQTKYIQDNFYSKIA